MKEPAVPATPSPPSNESGAQTLLKIYRQLCEWNCNGAGGVKRLSSKQRNKLNALYTPLIQAGPPAPLSDERPGGRPSAGSARCDDPDQAGILTGERNPTGPRVLVDVFTGMGGGPELDLLELRLHELDGVADVFVVTESRYGNHGDLKPLHFEAQKERFSAFLPRIVHVVTDDCPKYVKAAEKVQKDEKRGQGGVWNLQGIQRGCAVDALRLRSPPLPDDALVVLSDLDEIPNGRTFNMLKHCQLKPKARFPLTMSLTVIPFNLRSGCSKKRSKSNKGTVSQWKKFKKGKTTVWPYKGTAKVANGGTHLTSMGSLGQVSYKLLNHGESAQVAPLVLPGDVDIKTCSVTDVATVRLMQEHLNEKPLSVLRHWEKEKNKGKRKLKRATVAELAECGLPWPLLAAPGRYPFLWGEGTL